MPHFEVRRGTSPIILAFPHTGTDVPTDIRARMNDNGRKLADTDWHVHELYDEAFRRGVIKDGKPHRCESRLSCGAAYYSS
jgi:N-formylglutamate amidohydrolase